MFQAEVIREMSRRKQEDEQMNYLARIEELRREKDILIGRSPHYPDQRQLSDDQLVNYYENGFRVEQYQRELRERLGWAKHIADQMRNQNYKPLQRTKKKDQKIDSMRDKQTARNRSMQSIVGRSYVDELKTSNKWDQTIDTQFQKNQNTTFQPQSDNKVSGLLNYNLKKGKKIGVNKKYSKSVNKSTKRNNKSCKVSFTNNSISMLPKSISFSDSTIHSALKKISNRLKVSEIVYKDSKLRNAVHEMNHLVQTFEVQKKGRKQIRDKVNNHPSILKKHRLVAESR